MPSPETTNLTWEGWVPVNVEGDGKADWPAFKMDDDDLDWLVPGWEWRKVKMEVMPDAQP